MKILMAPQVMPTQKLPSDAANSTTAHTDLLHSGESSLSKIKMCVIIGKQLNLECKCMDFKIRLHALKYNNALFF